MALIGLNGLPSLAYINEQTWNLLFLDWSNNTTIIVLLYSVMSLPFYHFCPPNMCQTNFVQKKKEIVEMRIQYIVLYCDMRVFS